jgi:2-C-methyl-D-erythritol 4-phosphate cytidylyltransferase
MAQQTPLQRRGENGKPSRVDSQSSGCCASASPHRFAGQDQLPRMPRHLCLPPGVFIAGQRSHLGQVPAEVRVPAFEQRQQLVPDAVAGEAQMPVGRVFAPRLANGLEIGLDFAASRVEQRPENQSLGKFENRGDAAQALGPCTAQQLCQDGFGLVIERVRGRDCIEWSFGQEFSKPAVAQPARGFFERFGGFACRWIGSGFGTGIYARLVEGKAEFAGQRAAEFEIGVGFGSAQPMMQMRRVEHQAQFARMPCQRSQQGDRIGSAGKPDGQARAGPEQSKVQRQPDGGIAAVGSCGHVRMIDALRGGPETGECARRGAILAKVMQVFVILPAAGLGTRMAGPQPKQFLSLDGAPILIHSLRAFASVRRVTAIYVAVRKTEMERVQAQIAEHGFAGRACVVEGGEKRQESVANALAALPAAEDDIVLVHDAVRPLIDAATIERTIDAVAENGAAIVGLPAVDTIKQVDRTAHGAIITSTIPREFIVLAQTPQGFRYGLLKNAFAAAAEDGFVGTDEASLVERAGQAVHVVPGSQVNLKITQPGDLELAEFYLRRRSR